MDLHEEQKIRHWIRKILTEEAQHSEQLLVEYTREIAGGVAPRSSSNWGKAFYDPFADIFRAGKLGLKKIVAATDYNVRVMFTIRPSKMKAYRANYLNKAEKIEKDLKTVLDAAKKAAGPDMELISFMMNPSRYVVDNVAKGAAKGIAGAWNFFDDAIGETQEGTIAREEEEAKGVGVLPDPKKIIGGLMQDLNKLFFFAHHAPTGPILSEQDANKKELEGADYLEKKFAESGLNKVIEKSASQLIAIKQEQVNDVLKMLQPQLDLVQGLLDAKDSGSFGAVIDKAKAEDIDIGIDVSKLESDIRAATNKVLGDDSTREVLINQHRPKDEQGQELAKQDEEDQDWMPSEEQLRIDAETMVLKGALKEGGLVDSLFEAEAALKNQALELIDEPGLNTEAVASMKETKMGQQFLKVLDDAVAKITSA